eukprot:scaffold94116_cov30-Tisochrysis_lutea.AAC.4
MWPVWLAQERLHQPARPQTHTSPRSAHVRPSLPVRSARAARLPHAVLPQNRAGSRRMRYLRGRRAGREVRPLHHPHRPQRSAVGAPRRAHRAPSALRVGGNLETGVRRVGTHAGCVRPCP